MSKASSQVGAGAESWVERWQHWIAVLLSALLHLLLVLLAMFMSPPITMTPPQGTAAGSRVAVDFIGAMPPKQPTQAPPTQAAASKPVVKPPAASRVQTTRARHADQPVPPTANTVSDGLTASRDRPVPAQESMPTEATGDAAQGQAQAPVASSPPTPQRRSHTWGQPPGMMRENHASENAGLARSPSLDRGRRNDASNAEPSLEVGGYQVYYDLRSEIRLRAWRDQGMTEVFLPLPGTRRYMVCPLETALRRDSGPCRLLEPDDPELKNIGDAREVINMQQVYRRGEAVWRGPGPYR